MWVYQAHGTVTTNHDTLMKIHSCIVFKGDSSLIVSDILTSRYVIDHATRWSCLSSEPLALTFYDIEAKLIWVKF